MSYTEARVAQVSDLQDGDMKQVTVGQTDVLLARTNGVYHAVYAYCTHYGAALADGALSGERVVCPWHHACFHLPSGDQLEPPGLDSLPHFEVRLDGTDVVVRVPDEFETHRLCRMASRDTADDRVVAVLGAGAAGAYAVEALRQADFTGRILLITQENDLPYDRPNCSKEYLQGEAEDAWMPLRSEEFYAAHDIEVLTGRRVTRVDTAAKTLHFGDGASQAYDTLILCTGGTPRRLDVPGSDLDGVFTLRSYADSRVLREAAQGATRAVVIGASFIGMEVAYSLRKRGVDVTVVAPEEVPFAGNLGHRVGRRIQAEHQKHGVNFSLDTSVQALRGNQAVQRVVLQDGTVLDADLVVIGIGVTPATAFLHGFELAGDGGIRVDAYLQAGNGVYAAGDIARFPDWRTGESIRIEHWRLACQHGRLAGANAAGRSIPYRSLPFFWTVQFDLTLNYVGHAEGWDDILYHGEVEGEQWIAYYVKDDAIRAAIGANCDRDMAVIHELMRRELLPAPEALRQGAVDLAALLRAAGV